MTRTSFGAAIVAVLMGTGSFAADPPSGLPRPPQQDVPWTPPKADVPAALIEAARVLFDQGLADPRGCGYRQVELAGEVEERRFDSRPRPTIHAFVLPFDATGGPRYAVAWNGLVYPVTGLGPAADLDADVRALASVDVGERPYILLADPMHMGRAVGHLETAAQWSVYPVKIVMLLRLGRADLAAIVARRLPGFAGDPNRPGQVLTGHYANLAADWQWALLDRAGDAHANRDDRLALASLRELMRVHVLVAPRMPAPPPGPAGFTPPDFLVQFRLFLDDQERRARERKDRPSPGRTSPKTNVRIAALIRDLDEVGRPRMLPNAHAQEFVQASPIGADVVANLIREGEPAVGPLIEVIERDTRLTRIVQRDDRHGTRNLHVLGVESPAFQAIQSILETRSFGPQSRYYIGEGSIRGEVAEELRAYWKKNGGLGLLDRFFATLADDEATSEQWIESAAALARPAEGRNYGLIDGLPLLDGVKVRLRGEPLRSRKHPSVTDLMARRTREIEARETRPNWFYGVRSANRMARFLAAWDLPGSVPTLRDRVARSMTTLAEAPPTDNAVYDLPVEIAQFTILREKAGDRSALVSYAGWIRKQPRPHPLSAFAPEMFEPLWRYPDHPAIAAASRALFDDPNSPWVPLFGPGDARWVGRGNRTDLIVSPMLGVEPFRKAVLAGLADDRPSGPPTDAVPKGEPTHDASPILMRDRFAAKLGELDGFPRFDTKWSRDRRDQAIAGAVAVLTQYGERFRTNPMSLLLREKAPFYPTYQRAVMVFDPLDRPATSDDVSAGRAIFAADPGAEARRWPMPTFPMEGCWKRLKILRGDIYLSPNEPMPPPGSSRLEYTQRGLVWQAEEVREGGRWRRYYGFVGPRTLARIPAEEIDFPAPWNTGWTEASRDLEARLTGSGSMVLTLRNRRGIEVEAPTDQVHPGAVPSLRDGLTIRLFRRPDPTEPRRVAGLGHRPTTSPRTLEPWPEVVNPREPERYRSSSKMTLAPTATAEALRLDLDTFYGPLSPGGYRVEVEFGDIKASQDITIE